MLCVLVLLCLNVHLVHKCIYDSLLLNAWVQGYVCVVLCVCVCVSVRGWKSYDMWQLVGRCQRGRMEQRRKRLLPWQRWAGVADGRVAWSSCQLRQWELQRNNANDSLLLLWLWTTGIRNILYARETHVPSQMTTADHYTALALISPSHFTRFSTHDPSTLSSPSRSNSKQFVCSLLAIPLLTGNKRAAVGPCSCLKSYTRVVNTTTHSVFLLIVKYDPKTAEQHGHSACTLQKIRSRLFQLEVQCYSHWMGSTGHLTGCTINT